MAFGQPKLPISSLAFIASAETLVEAGLGLALRKPCVCANVTGYLVHPVAASVEIIAQKALLPKN